jgi:histidinol-phosphate aminotransferase
VFLNANESPWPPLDDQGLGLNRYPDPQPCALVRALADLYGVQEEQVLVGRGSDEAIDLLVRAFCRPNTDAVAICPPTFGMYAVAAGIQGARLLEAPLRADFTLDADALLETVDGTTKLVFLCSPNNPTGAAVPLDAVQRIAETLRDRAMVVVDEAYIEFAETASARTLLSRFDNLGVLRTLSKAHALAGARIGTLLAAPVVIELLRRIMPPYPLPTPCVAEAMAALSPAAQRETARRIVCVRAERRRLSTLLPGMPGVREVLPSAANFLTVRFDDAASIYRAALAEGIVLRDVGRYPGLDNCLRIGIGAPEENDAVLDLLRSRRIAVA